MGVIRHSDLVSRKRSGDFDVVGKVSTQSVHKHTGKHWKEWIIILEKAGAPTWTHQELVAHLKETHRLSPWWQQGVALGFEIVTGRRKPGQDAKGKYMTTVTKSLPCDPKSAWKFLVLGEGKCLWLNPIAEIEIIPKTQFETNDGFFGEIRSMMKPRRVRLTWQDPLWDKHTVVELHLVPKPEKKSLLVINHIGIHDAKTKAMLHARWRNAADQIPPRLAP